MSAAPKLREVETTPAPFPSPERATLAALIATSREAKRTEAETREALRRARERVTTASAGLNAARRAFESAKEALTDRAAQSAASGIAPVPDRSLRDARSAEVEAADNVDIAGAALDTLEADLRKAEYAAQKAGEKVADAAQAVIQEEIPRLLVKAKEKQKTADRSRAALRLLMEPFEMQPWNKASWAPHLTEASSFTRCQPHYDESDHNAVAPWKQWMEALLEDANAVMPE